MSPENAANDTISAFLCASLRGMESGRIRRLKGFIKGAHFEPDSHSPAAEGFVRKAGAPDIEERAEALFRQVRLAFGYKRKELVYSCDAGTAAIKGVDFEVTLSVDQDPEDARGYRIAVNVGEFKRPEVVTHDAFIEVFRHHCDTVVMEFGRSIDVEATIDVLEEASNMAEFLDYPADGSSLSIKVPGQAIAMELHSDCVRFSIRPGGDLRELVHGSIRLLREMSRAGAGLFLPD